MGVVVNETVNDRGGYLDGEWHASSMGEFVSLLVDGADPAVLFRVIEDGPQDKRGHFTRRLDVLLVPNGQIMEQCKAHGIERAHKVLVAFLEAGVMS
jgi:hypothetical protein